MIVIYVRQKITSANNKVCCKELSVPGGILVVFLSSATLFPLEKADQLLATRRITRVIQRLGHLEPLTQG